MGRGNGLGSGRKSDIGSDIGSDMGMGMEHKGHGAMSGAGSDPGAGVRVASPARRALGRLMRNRLAMVGGLLAFVVIGASLLAPWLSAYGPKEMDFARTWEGPSRAHLLGTDNLGRDVLARILFGGRVSLLVGILSQLIVLAIGVTMGALAGYFGGRVDTVVMRITDVMLAFPGLLLIILLMTVLNSGLTSMVVAIGLSQWTVLARLVRGSFMALRKTEMVEAGRAVGATGWRLITRYLLPNSAGPVIVNLTFGIPTAIMTEAGLSYIGIGMNPPTPSWGLMLSEGFSALQSHPHLIAAPALAIAGTMLAFVFFGNGLQDAIDVRQQ